MMPQTRRTLKKFVPRLQCRVAGHAMGDWRRERLFNVHGKTQVSESRVCERYCGIEGSYEFRTRVATLADFP